MPIFEYRCPHCGEHIEKFQKPGAEPLQLCSSCGKLGLEKLVSAAGFKLSGSGWYETDFKNKPKAEDKKSNADNKPEADKQSDVTEKVTKPQEKSNEQPTAKT